MTDRWRVAEDRRIRMLKAELKATKNPRRAEEIENQLEALAERRHRDRYGWA